jgi:hypothetical protein
MTEQSDVMDGLEEAYRDGLVNVEHSGDPADEPRFSLSEHGDAAANDLLRENEAAVIQLVNLHCAEMKRQNRDIPQSLAALAVLVGENVGVNIYRVLARHLDDIPWLTGDAITDEQIQAVEQHIDENKERYNES